MNGRALETHAIEASASACETTLMAGTSRPCIAPPAPHLPAMPREVHGPDARRLDELLNKASPAVTRDGQCGFTGRQASPPGAKALQGRRPWPGARSARRNGPGAYARTAVEVECAAGRIAYGPVSERDVPELLKKGLLRGDAHPLRLGPIEDRLADRGGDSPLRESGASIPRSERLSVLKIPRTAARARRADRPQMK
jgi:hypothetical protein